MSQGTVFANKLRYLFRLFLHAQIMYLFSVFVVSSKFPCVPSYCYHRKISANSSSLCYVVMTCSSQLTGQQLVSNGNKISLTRVTLEKRLQMNLQFVEAVGYLSNYDVVTPYCLSSFVRQRVWLIYMIFLSTCLESIRTLMSTSD